MPLIHRNTIVAPAVTLGVHSNNDPPTLYLDNAWRELQILFNRDPPKRERGAMSLVRGNVTHTNEGWISCLAVLDATRVAAASVDLAAITESDVRVMIAARRGKYPQYGSDGEARYIRQNLCAAQAFCADLSEKGLGLAYEIG